MGHEVLGCGGAGLGDARLLRARRHLVVGHAAPRLQIRAKLGSPIELYHLFRHPTVRTLAPIVDGARDTAAPGATHDRFGEIASAAPPAPPPGASPVEAALQEVESATGYFGPASFGQERLHVMEIARQPGRSAYAMSYALRLDGAVDVDLVRRAVEAIVARHDVLRSSFLAERDALQVFVRDVLPLDIPLLDFIDRGEAEQLDAVREELCRLTLAPFDLAQGPLLRFSLMRLDGLRHVLGMSVHHIVADGQSLALFRDELAAGFAAGSGAPTLPELPIQYVDFAEWERAEAAGGQDAAAAFWADQLGEAHRPCSRSCPHDFPRAAAYEDDDAAPSGATATRVLPHDAVERLLETARARRATPWPPRSSPSSRC